MSADQTSNLIYCMIWNQNIECMDREQLREIQSIRLRKMADYVYHNSPFYRRKFQEMGLLEISGDRIRLTDAGIDVSNRVFEEFLLEASGQTW